MPIVNLIEEWRQVKRRSVREAKIWSAALVLGVLGALAALGVLLLQIPKAAQERDKWAKRAERLESVNSEAAEQPVLAISPEMLASTRMQCMELSLSFAAVTRLLPKGASLQEVTFSRNPETGLEINLRGAVQGFEPVRIYTERLRRIGLFSDVTPLSVTRSEGENSGAKSHFEIRITLPSNQSETDTGDIVEERS